MTLSELITLLEGAGEGSRMLDAEIVVALNLRPEWTCDYGELYLWNHEDVTPEIKIWTAGRRRSAGHPSLRDDEYKHYTTSVDAALSLIPDGMEIRLDKLVGPNGWEHCCDLCGNGATRTDTDTKASSLPLAICIAALRAHSTLSEQGKGGGG